MKIIPILNSKGGAGKTTLTTCLAVMASKEARVAVVDLDPQGSYGLWYTQRKAPDNPVLMRGMDRASDAVEALRLTSPHDVVFMDGPPGSLLVTEDAIAVADLVVVPMRASPIDIGASRDVLGMCRDAGKPALVVLNDVAGTDKKLAAEARALLASWGFTVAVAEIKHRVAYANAYTSGATGPEKSRDAAAEIAALWSEIKTALKAGGIR